MVTYSMGLKKQPLIVRQMREKPGLQRAMEQELDALGFRHFSYVGAGEFALALHTVDNQVVRLCDGLFERERIKHPAILQPIDTHRFSVDGKEYMIEVLPRVRTDNVKKNDSEKVKRALELSGIEVFDVRKAGNVGYIDVNGKDVPVLVDAGMARYSERLRCEQQKHDTGHLSEWIGKDGVWLQHKLEKRTKPSGVITGEQLAEMEWGMGKYQQGADADDRKGPSQTLGAISEDGFYAVQVEKMYAEAVKKLDAQPDANFSDLLKAERKTLKTERDRER